MRVFVKATSDAIKALRRDLPDGVVNRILGQEVVVNDRFEYQHDEHGIPATWALPPEAVRVVEEDVP